MNLKQIVAVGVLGLGLHASVHSQSLNIATALKEYLDTDNLPKREYLDDVVVMSGERGLQYVEHYTINPDLQIACYYNFMQVEDNVLRRSQYPFLYMINGGLYLDKSQDGLTGDEVYTGGVEE